MISRKIEAKFPGKCRKCAGAVAVGENVVWHRASEHGGRGSIYHPACAPTSETTVEPPSLPTPTELTEPDALDTLARALLPKLEKLGIRGGADTEERDAVREILIARTASDGDGIEIDMPHPLFERLLTVAQARLNAYVWGAPGAGKSHAAADVARALGVKFRYVSLCPQSMPSLLTGYMNANGEYVRTAFRECYENGGVFCIDEVDNANANLLASLNSALANGLAEFPDAQVVKHPDCVVIATGNTAGAGPTLAFPDRRPLDLAFRDRFLFLAWGYSKRHELRIAKALASAPPARVEAAEAYTKWIHACRAHCDIKYPALVCSPRAAYAAVRLLATLPVEVVADLTLFQGIEEGVKATILEACPLPKLVLTDTQPAAVTEEAPKATEEEMVPDERESAE